MRKLKIPIVTEGKYDKIKLSSVIDAVIITTGGFSVFKNDEKKALIRTLGKNGLILLCDSDGGGKTIRSHLKGMLGGISVYELYIPQIEGRERRKKAPSKEGYLGVEGMDTSLLRELFEKLYLAHPELFADESDVAAQCTPVITKADMYELGLTGGANSSAMRDRLAESLSLPKGMSANALCEALRLMGIGKVQLEAISGQF